MKRGKAYAHYRAVIGVLTMKGDLLDRGPPSKPSSGPPPTSSTGSAAAPGPAASRRFAPAGREQVVHRRAAGVDEVSLLGETLDALTPAGHETVVMPGRRWRSSAISCFEYHPAPPPRK